MAGTGVSTRAILTRRLNAAAAGGVRHNEKRSSFELFCCGQVERIERITTAQLKRVAQARRDGIIRARKVGEELQVEVKGSVGSDVHPGDDTTPVPLV